MHDFVEWGASTITVLIISSLALIGGLMFPCLEKDFVKDLLTLFIGLAVGTMAGDALLHLIPLVGIRMASPSYCDILVCLFFPIDFPKQQIPNFVVGIGSPRP